ncbi:hypothetical protein CYLTODRAFT_450563 [Cylindrobasidium torrendii FP15055 ss-10]|uniref:Uncharacterized protein n=1 Tax=Cylindrobasidium torrendii FP15055 ss-10 TaxID=1314674 RepID=A0A0D7BMP2_9AGAR|nr:hypothetical protein CYLTODRAFT_450563 [Cylindrobasidium torrendii FP15055 ss-10]
MSHHVPRFSNPYNLPETTQFFSRHDLQEDKEDAPVDFDDEIQQLHNHLAGIFEIPSLPTTSIAPIPSEPADIVFRIWSTSEAQPIKLSNVITWEGIRRPPPPAEDTKPERKLRRRRAQASAIDGTLILTEAAPQLCSFI